MNDGCRPSLAVATTDNIALVASGASMESSSTYVGRNETASFRKQGYSLSASGSTEEEWFSASTRKHMRWEWTFLHQPLWDDVQIQNKFGNWFPRPRGTMPCPAELGWGLLSGPAEVNAHQAWKSCPVLECLEPWSSIPYAFAQLSLWLTFVECLSVLCLLLTDEGTKQGCGWKVSPGLNSVGNLGSVVCGSWNSPAFRMSEPSQASLLLRCQARGAWNLPTGNGIEG